MAEKKCNMTIGCDPEFFLKDSESGKLISAIPHVTGTKEVPLPLPGGGNIQRDNVAVEVATAPASSCEMFVAGIERILKEAVNVLPKGTEIVALPSASFEQDELEHPEAQRFGCDPDFDAWEVCQNDPPCAADPTFRSCGAHIHVGTDGSDGNSFLLEFEGKLLAVKVMDCIHGLISTVLDSSKESIDRRKLYGKPGAHRPKDYGVEYRVLSNYWLKSPITVMLMYHLTQDALSVIREGKAEGLIEAIGADQVKSIITQGDAEAADKAINVHILKVLSEDSLHYFKEALEKVKITDSFHSEWKLYGKGAS